MDRIPDDDPLRSRAQAAGAGQDPSFQAVVRGSRHPEPGTVAVATADRSLAHERKQLKAARGSASLTRRTTLGMAGSAAALSVVAVAASRNGALSLNGDELASGTAGRSAKGSAAAAAADGKAQRVEYQAAAAGTAPQAQAVAKAVQPPTILRRDPAIHLARRATWGPTAGVVQDIRRQGLRRWVDRQLQPSRIDDATVARLLASYDTLGKTPEQLRGMNKEREKADYWYAHSQLEAAAILRATWSNRQLYEVMVDFFHSRLHVPARFDKSRDTLNHYDTAVIRRHALGKFSNMVWAMVRHPAMIVYLDNQNNTKNGGNQNLGRELLELHTLGVNAGYKQADVEAAAKLLTGFSVDGETLKFVYRPEQHAVGRVRVFGKTYRNASAAGGVATVKTLVRDLTRHPATARYLALELARRFVSDQPSQRLVRQLAAVYLKNDTAIAPVLRALFASPEFAASVGQKYRRPLENTVATMRILGLRPGPADKLLPTLLSIRYDLERAGQSPLGRNTPDGFPDFARPWLSSVGTLSRWNMQMSLVGGWRDGLTKPDIDRMLAGVTTYGAAVDRLVYRLQYQKATRRQRAALLEFLGRTAKSPLSAEARKGDHNLRVRLPALILGGPHHQLR